MSEVVYRSDVRIERVKRALRWAYPPAEMTPVMLGVVGVVDGRHRAPQPLAGKHDTTLDYIVAATAG